MRIRIASAVMAPILWALGLLFRFASWIHQQLSGLTPISAPDEIVAERNFYDFKENSGFRELMEAPWFLAALRTITRAEIYQLMAELRSAVARRAHEDASLTEAVITVFEDIEAVFRKYAKLYEPPGARRPRS